MTTAPMVVASTSELETIVSIVRAQTGVDLRSYRQTTVQRRLRARMQRVRARDIPDYAAMLRLRPVEAEELLRYVRINVTRFFRNASAFGRLAGTVLPALAGERPAPLRIWSAGCSTGEEVYSLLMLLDHALGERLREVTFVASDADDSAVRRAAAPALARFSPESTAEVPMCLGSRYLAPVADRVGQAQPAERLAALAGQVTWLQHDLLSAAAPEPGQFDLVVCRNVLIYFKPAEQERVQQSLAHSLAPGGFLFLGEAESLHASVADRFEVVDSGTRLFRLRSERSPQGQR